MKPVNLILFSLAGILMVPPAAWAIKVKTIDGASVTQSAPPASVSKTIGRGGTVNSVNRQGRTITVDGITYPLASSFNEVPAILKKGTKIRFETIKDSLSRKEIIIGISIANPPGEHAPGK
jgi:hypothetical protein